jgi:Predicted GTPase
VNFYDVDGVDLVDLPGYGYAKRSKTELQRWSDLIEGYFDQDRQLALVVSLIDIRHDPSALDHDMVAFLVQSELPFAIALTKADKLSRQKALRQAAVIKKQLELPKGTPVILTSSSEGTGVDDLRRLIRDFVKGLASED